MGTVGVAETTDIDFSVAAYPQLGIAGAVGIGIERERDIFKEGIILVLLEKIVKRREIR